MKKKLVDFININKQFYENKIKYPKIKTSLLKKEYCFEQEINKYELSILGISLSFYYKLNMLKQYYLDNINTFNIEEEIVNKCLRMNFYSYIQETYKENEEYIDTLKELYQNMLYFIFDNHLFKDIDFLIMALFEMEYKTGIQSNINNGFSIKLINTFNLLKDNFDLNMFKNISTIELEQTFLNNEYIIDNNLIINNILFDISIADNLNIKQHLKKLIYKTIAFKKFNFIDIKQIVYINIKYKYNQIFNMNDLLNYEISKSSIEIVNFIYNGNEIDEQIFFKIIETINEYKKMFLIKDIFFYCTNFKFVQFIENNYKNILSQGMYSPLPNQISSIYSIDELIGINICIVSNQYKYKKIDKKNDNIKYLIFND